jgi:tripartite-type tricarboxylate transporter receptor subunit TctC
MMKSLYVDAAGACTSAWGAAGADSTAPEGAGAGVVSAGAGSAWGRHLARTLPAAGRDSSSMKFVVSNQCCGGRSGGQGGLTSLVDVLERVKAHFPGWGPEHDQVPAERAVLDKLRPI